MWHRAIAELGYEHSLDYLSSCVNEAPLETDLPAIDRQLFPDQSTMRVAVGLVLLSHLLKKKIFDRRRCPPLLIDHFNPIVALSAITMREDETSLVVMPVPDSLKAVRKTFPQDKLPLKSAQSSLQPLTLSNSDDKKKLLRV